jgi:hypothetical protein
MDIVVMPGRAPVVAGPATVPCFSPMAPGTRVYGLRFRPGAAPFVVGVAAEELRDLAVARRRARHRPRPARAYEHH